MITIEAAAILFDNDGVLVDSHDTGSAAWEQLCGEFGLDFSVVRQEFVGRRASDTLARYVDPSRHNEACRRLEDLEVEGAAATPVLAGARQVIDALRSARWAVATSATHRLAWARWSAAGIEPPVTVTGEEVSRGKPDPEPYLLAAERLGVDVADCVVMEDAPAGGRAGRDAGATVIAIGDIDWEFEPAVRVPDLSKIDVVAASPDGITLTVEA